MRKKVSDLISTVTMVIIVLSAVSSAFQIIPEKAYANPAISNTVSISPMQLTLIGALPQTFTYWVNVTSTGTEATDFINRTSIHLPTTGAFAYAGGATAQGFGFTVSASNSLWVNFTTTQTTFFNGSIANFSIPVTILTAPTIDCICLWNIYAYQGVTASTSTPVAIQVEVNLEFHATMTPNYVANNRSYIYTITITNDAVPTGIIAINITFPAGTWEFNVLLQSSPATWTVQYDNINTFYLTGPNLFAGQSASITVNMTTPLSAVSGEYNWAVRAWNAGDEYLGAYNIRSVVDTSAPIISFIAPSVPYYSVGSGNYVWINLSMVDTPSIETYFSQYVVTCNDTRFQPYSPQPWTETSATIFVFYYVNVTAVPDGLLTVQFTGTDPAGNTGSATTSTTVDNTMPKLIFIEVVDQDLNSLHVDDTGTYWMRDTTTAILVGAAFFNLQGFTGNIYFNSTSYTFTNSSSPSLINWMPNIDGYNVTGANMLTINITLAYGTPTTRYFTVLFTIMRDTVPPSAPTFGTTKTICGGVVIPDLTATDNVGVDEFRIYLNGSWFAISSDDLNSDTLNLVNGHVSFKDTAVVNLFEVYLAGEVANVTIVASDYGGNTGPAATFFVTVPAGLWYPLELYPEWNLISLPLIPNSTVTADVFSLLLSQGAAGVDVAYGFDSVAKTWNINPASMTDGKGYWISMKAYDVLIVQGFPTYAPPGSPPPVVEYDLKQGWNLVGFTATGEMEASDYVASMQSTLLIQSYFRYAYAWNAQDQNWFNIDFAGSFGITHLVPGQGFWIYTYSDQALIPPV